MNRSRRGRRALIILLVILLFSAGGFALYVSDVYPADAAAQAVLDTPGVQAEEGLITLLPEETSDTAILFYPGAKVEATAYLPLLDQLRDEGFTAGKAFSEYQVMGIPCCLVLDPQGRFYKVNMRGAYLDAFLQELYGR